MATGASSPGAGCGGEGCKALDPWPLLLVHLSSSDIFSRLCTSCVLKYNASLFCTLCFSLLGDGDGDGDSKSQSGALVHCNNCPSVSHLSCLPDPDLGSQFVCPSCKDPEGFSYFVKEKRKMIGDNSARALVAASELAADSMRAAARKRRAEAERKVREAVRAKKRARAIVDKAIVVCAQEKERNAALSSKKNSAGEEPKRKAEQKRAPSREIEKWMRIHEPVPMTAEMEKMKGDGKSRVAGCLGQEEKEKNGNVLNLQSDGKDRIEERSLAVGGDKGGKLQQQSTVSTQGEENFHLLILLSLVYAFLVMK